MCQTQDRATTKRRSLRNMELDATGLKDVLKAVSEIIFPAYGNKLSLSQNCNLAWVSEWKIRAPKRL